MSNRHSKEVTKKDVMASMLGVQIRAEKLCITEHEISVVGVDDNDATRFVCRLCDGSSPFSKRNALRHFKTRHGDQIDCAAAKTWVVVKDGLAMSNNNPDIMCLATAIHNFNFIRGVAVGGAPDVDASCGQELGCNANDTIGDVDDAVRPADIAPCSPPRSMLELQVGRHIRNTLCIVI